MRYCRHTALATFNSASTNRALFLTRRLRTESHQTSVGIKRVALLCERPGGGCRPRETSVPSRVQGVACTARGYRRGDDASPLVATAWAIQQLPSCRWRQGGVQITFVDFTSRFPGSPPRAKPLREASIHIERLLLAQHVVAGPRQLVASAWIATMRLVLLFLRA